MLCDRTPVCGAAAKGGGGARWLPDHVSLSRGVRVHAAGGGWGASKCLGQGVIVASSHGSALEPVLLREIFDTHCALDLDERGVADQKF